MGPFCTAREAGKLVVHLAIPFPVRKTFLLGNLLLALSSASLGDKMLPVK